MNANQLALPTWLAHLDLLFCKVYPKEDNILGLWPLHLRPWGEAPSYCALEILNP